MCRAKGVGCKCCLVSKVSGIKGVCLVSKVFREKVPGVKGFLCKRRLAQKVSGTKVVWCEKCLV